MRLRFVVPVLLCVALPAFGQPKGKKEPEFVHAYATDDVSFKAYFTEKPRTVTKKHDTKAGPITVTTVSVETRDLIYAVVETTFPEKFKDAEPKKLLAAAVDGLSANGGKVIATAPMAIAGPDGRKVEGKDVTVEFGSKRVRTRLAVSGLTLVQASVTGTKAYVDAKPAEQFLRAVELTK
jgi:hypothetical protein